MTLPGVGVFAGENTRDLVRELRKAGFDVRVIWSSGKWLLFVKDLFVTFEPFFVIKSTVTPE